MTRTVTVHYEDTTGEHPIEVTLCREGLGHNDWVIETDLSDVPADELAGVRQRAIDLYCEAEARESSDDDRGPGTASHRAVTARRASGPSGKHSTDSPRRKLSAPAEAWLLWDLAVAHAQDESWAEWARNALTVAAAHELGLDPIETLSEVGV